ncbi:MAG: prolyl oligopeptidase family serine peptidase [Rhizomicrobium sp.]
MIRKTPLARIAVGWVSLFLWSQHALASVLTEQDVLDRAWADKPLFATENMIPSWIAHTHRFIYSEMNGGTGKLVDFDADTGRAAPLGEGQGAAVSPDGRSMLFLAHGADGKGTVLWMMGTDGTGRHMVDSGDRVDPTGAQYVTWTSYHWSPDGRHFFRMALSLNQLANVKPSGETSTVHAYPIDTSQDSRLASKIAVFSAAGDLLRKWTVKQAVPDVEWLGNGALVYSRTDGRPVFTAHAAVYAFDIQSGREEKLFDGFGRQVTYRPAASPDGGRIAFIADPGEPVFTPGRRELAVFDVRTHAVKVLTENAAIQSPRWSDDGRTLYFTDGMSTQRQLKAVLADGRIVVLSTELGQTLGLSQSDDGRWAAWTVHKPFEAFVIHVAPGTLPAPLQATRTLDVQPASFGPEFGTTTALTWKSPDGTVIDGLLTVPPGYDRHRTYPLVVQVHGGPQGGVEMTDYGWPGDGYFDALLASRGYMVLRPDYRASGELGWGPYIRSKNAGRIFADDRADIESGVQMLIDGGSVDPTRLILIGLSYGGAMTNYIATHSTMFRAAITYEGLDYLTDWGGRPEWPDHNVSVEWEMGGTPFDRLPTYMANSVVPALRTASTPMMLVNGEHGINSASSPLIYNSLRLRGIDAQFLYYEGEGHGIQQHVNQADFLARIMAWIGKYAPVKE